jgi:dGTPase
MDWADDVAYSVHDLEDGLVSGFLLHPLFLEERFIDSVYDYLQRTPVRSKPSKPKVKKVLEELRERLGGWQPAPSMATIREVTRHFINRFVVAVEIKSPKSIRNSFDSSVCVPQDLREECSVLKAMTFEFIIRDERTTTFAYKGREIVRRIFEALRENTHEVAGKDRFELFPRYLRHGLEDAIDNQSDLYRMACDYVASMTDGQAIRLYRRLFEPTGGSPFEPV